MMILTKTVQGFQLILFNLLDELPLLKPYQNYVSIQLFTEHFCSAKHGVAKEASTEQHGVSILIKHVFYQGT